VKIGGLLKFSMIDFPGNISAIVFTQGCNLRCVYCHNPELIGPAPLGEQVYEEADILDYLEKRRGCLDGVVITGGEPTMQADLPAFARKLKAMGYLVKLDTNGTNPVVLEELIRENLVDFIAMDIKAPFEKFEILCGVKPDTAAILRSIALIAHSGLKYEFRTTYDTTVLNDADIAAMRAMAPGNYRVQECNPVPLAGAKPTLKLMQQPAL
jgi:pyruvate formate lyase activating enzyme